MRRFTPCSPVARRVTRPDEAIHPETEPSGEDAHFRALERLYASAPINRLFPSRLHIPAPGEARIQFDVAPAYFHAAGATHGTLYFKMLDDAAFYAANSLVSDRFLLTTAFNLLFTKPLKAGPIIAEGRWLSGKRRVYVAEARLIDGDGEEVGRGTGTFMRSTIPLASLPGYSTSNGDEQSLSEA
ncbi:PaaI family thioesterase [Sphingobium nicotianae]|uniref:PaaI family thioesterase n=1 Tax=Sphingobium nicotianae TaxID=2782607 RepID=A0A9X1IST8_9SPHN|nr:PaaI family thioesterase [Sphingobium nicotianae]MBT2188594.1 PaaI family thioesterase [Sphingobium nicotianae]